MSALRNQVQRTGPRISEYSRGWEVPGTSRTQAQRSVGCRGPGLPSLSPGARVVLVVVIL